MPSRTERVSFLGVGLREPERIMIEEVFRLGALRDGVQLTTTDIRMPVLGQVIPRLEVEISSPRFRKKITVRVNQSSPFRFDGQQIAAVINGAEVAVACVQFVDDERAPVGMYNFGLLRENGLRSFVFDYHTYCAFSCDFCFKESEWEVLSISGASPVNYKANFEKCLEYVSSHADDFRSKYDIVWLCTGSITNEELELDRHARLATALRDVGFNAGIYVSQVIPAGVRHDQKRRLAYLERLHGAGISRFNSGVEIVNNGYRRRYVHGYKGTLTFDDYVATFTDAVKVFGRHNVGSCVLAGIEPADDTLRGLEVIARLGVVPSPTVLTPFVVKQQAIPFQYDLDTLIDVHLDFTKLIARYELPVFSGVFSLA